MVIRLPKLLLFAEDIWKKALARFGPPADKPTAKSNMPTTLESSAANQSAASTMPSVKVTTTAAAPAAPPTTTTTTTPSTTTTTTAAASPMATKKRCWRRKTVHFTVFLAVFSTILSLLWVYTLTAELRRKAFDVNMRRDRVLDVSMDNPDLASYIRNIHLKAPIAQEQLNASQTLEEEFIVKQLQAKRNGLYFEYMSRAGATSTTAWLESQLDWRGVMVFTDPRHFFDAYRSARNPKTRVLHACLSTDRDTREITYHQEADVQVMKLGEGPNSLDLSTESLPVARLYSFPLYSILLAYNTTNLDYLNLDSSEVQDGLILDTVPWDVIRVSVLSLHWGAHHSDAETKSIVDKLSSHNYKFVKSLSTGKLVFLYNRRPKI